MSGKVYLVGAGPGDPGLLTARALELIASADVILYDRLIPSTALDGARADAELLFVGKEGGGPSVAQEQTEALMIERAQAGRSVVRLKGGDPFVFGRGGEEALALRAAGIEYEVVPGVTAGVAASAYAGIPVTHRGLARAVALVTGQTREDGAGPGDGTERGGEQGDDGTVDWRALAAFPGTLVLYMGVRRLEQIARSLIDAGRPASEPAAVVEAGTLPTQRTVSATLGTIAETARREQIRAPAITVVGAVAALAEELAWLPERPLRGVKVAVTRARAQASGLAQKLEALGAHVIQAPVIRVRQLTDPDHATLDPTPYDLICVTSANGVAGLFERLDDGSHPRGDARALAGTRIAAIGSATARALAERGIVADVLPERSVAESLVEALAEVPVQRALIARARGARDVLPDALRARGVEVDILEPYETVAEPLAAEALQAVRDADYVTFTSSSTVRFLLQAVGGGDAGLSPGTRLVSIGPATSAALREAGLEAHIEADPYDVEGMIAALLADAASQATDGR
jgi:uroporphyrinogen III methyltransferase/synthase